MRLPLVEQSTMNSAISSLLDLPFDGENLDGLTDQVLEIAAENSNVLAAVQLMACDESPEFQSAALMGMAVTYNVLRAQLEIEDLNRLLPAKEARRIRSAAEVQSRGRWIAARGRIAAIVTAVREIFEEGGIV